MINCLSYALRFWNTNKKYRIYYNSDHCINLPIKDGHECCGFLPIEEYGYDYFKDWYIQGLIDISDLVLLHQYFILGEKT